MPLENSPGEEGFEAAWVEEGTITRIDAKTFKIDWVGDASDREISEIQLLSPYAHQAFGEGLSIIPDIGAKAYVCQPSDDSHPFVLGFYMDPGEYKDKNGETEHSYQAGRQKMLPGEMKLQGRKGNMIYLRRGGVLQLGASPACHTFYFPVSNFLWNVCQRYKLDTSGGEISWEKTNVGDGTELRALVRDRAGDQKASVGIRLGNILDATPIPATSPGQIMAEFVVAPTLIDSDGRSATQKFALRVDKNGNAYQMAQGSVVTITQDEVFHTMRARRHLIQTDDLLTIQGNRTEIVLGMQESTALRQVLRAATEILLEAPLNRYGSIAASQPGILGVPLLQALIAHTHPGPRQPSEDLANAGSALMKKHLFDG